MRNGSRAYDFLQSQFNCRSFCQQRITKQDGSYHQTVSLILSQDQCQIKRLSCPFLAAQTQLLLVSCLQQKSQKFRANVTITNVAGFNSDFFVAHLKIIIKFKQLKVLIMSAEIGQKVAELQKKMEEDIAEIKRIENEYRKVITNKELMMAKK